MFGERCLVAALLAMMIALNTVTMAIESQYMSFDTAFQLGYPNSSLASETWPGANIGFLVIQMFFGSVFMLEVILKFAVGPRVFARSAWNWFDTLVVVFWLASLLSFGFGMVLNPMMLRLVRLARLLRLVRLVKTIELFDVLHLLVGSLRASAKVLLWSLALLVAIMMAAALVLNFLFEPYIIDDSKSYEPRADVYERFGSFSRSFVTVFEMTLGNWGPPVLLVQNHVNEAYGPLLLIYVGLVHFSVVQVIRGVFMHETFQVAALDDDIMVMQRNRQVRMHQDKMERLFKEADASGDGYLSFQEFDNITKDEKIEMWLSAMGLDVSTYLI